MARIHGLCVSGEGGMEPEGDPRRRHPKFRGAMRHGKVPFPHGSNGHHQVRVCATEGGLGGDAAPRFGGRTSQW